MKPHGVCAGALQRKQAEVEAEFARCIECGACYIDCPFDLWGKSDEERRQTVRDANDFIFGRKPVTDFLKSEIFRCAECDKCHRPCPAGIHRKHANMLIKLSIQPKNVDRLKSHPARLRGTKQYFFELTNVRKWRPEERAWYEGLNPSRTAQTLIYNGCYVASRKEECMKLEEMLAHGGVDFVSFGRFEYCCGQFGLYRGVSDLCATLPKVVEMIEIVQPREVITNCGHCREAVEDALTAMGRAGVRVMHPADKLLELVHAGKLRLNPLGSSVTIQDACLYDQNRPDSPVRNLLGRVVNITENKDSLVRSRCCGDVAHVADPQGVQAYNEKRRRTFQESGAEWLAVYCAGCKDIYAALEGVEARDLIEVLHDAWQGGRDDVR